MLNWLQSLSPVTQAIVATTFTWFVTALGAAVVFFFKDLKKWVSDGLLGFAAGVMIAVSYWSLLAPAVEMSKGKGLPSWMPAIIGFVGGVIFLRFVDMVLPHLHLNLPIEEAEGIRTPWRRSILLVLAITLHNIPEGLAIGVAFGAASAGLPSASFIGAVVLAFGIGLQNFPEGLAVSLPLRREGMSRIKSFWYGQLSGIVEPIAAVVGAVIVISSQVILPYALSFAAGAMLFVVVEELIPESHRNGHSDIATMGTMLGFAVMMLLDIAFT